MNAEFQWWLLILGIVIGGALVYLVMADLRSDEVDADDDDDAAGHHDEADERADDDQPLGAVDPLSQQPGPARS